MNKDTEVGMNLVKLINQARHALGGEVRVWLRVSWEIGPRERPEPMIKKS